MKVAMIGDSHFDESKRFAECIRLHAWIADDARARGVDLVLHGGDVFERKSTPGEREAAFSWFQAMADIAPVVAVRGNHDFLGDLPLMRRLETTHPITVVEDAAVVEVAGALVACLAWPRKAQLLAATGAESHDDGEALAADAMRDVLRGLGGELQGHAGPTMWLGHVMLRDSMTSTGQPLVGSDLELTLADLSLCEADAYFAAHIHMHQGWTIERAPVLYPGSPRRTSFGEIEAKGYVVAEWDDATAELVGWEFVEAPATPMIHVEDEWTANGWAINRSHDDIAEPFASAELRFRYRVRSDQRQAARAAAEAWRDAWLAEGAISVKLDEQVILEHRSRAEAIPAKATLAEKLEAFWAAKGFAPGERRPALLAKVQLIQEARHAA